jgi:hypothetical protein
MEPSAQKPRGSSRDPRLRISIALIVTLAVILFAGIVLLIIRDFGTSGVEAPYTRNRHRLQDVTAAIQLLATYEWHNSKIEQWVTRIEPSSRGTKRDRSAAVARWTAVFSEHPEFFHIDESENRVALRWRYAYEPRYDPLLDRELSYEEFAKLPPVTRSDSLSRKPLDSDQIGTLLTTAIQLHSAEIARQQEQRWLVASLFALLGSIIGGLLGALLGIGSKMRDAEESRAGAAAG